MNSPRVSVLLPVYADEPFLEEALDSLAAQTYEDFDVVAVTEEASDAALDALQSSSLDVQRIIYDGEGGLADALNVGIEAANGEYIARMDADDIAHPDRLVTQVTFLDNNPKVGIVGSAYTRIGSEGQEYGTVMPPTSHLAIRWQLLLTSCIPHPTAMIRRSLLKETGIRYRPAFEAVEDFDLWTRLAHHTRLRNLDQSLLKYRIEGKKKSDLNSESKQAQIARIIQREVEDVLSNFQITDEELVQLRRLLYDGAAASVDKRRAGGNYLRMLVAFEQTVADGRRVRPVRTHATVTLARGVLRPPIQIDSLPVLVWLLKIMPSYPLEIVRFLYDHRVATPG
jgi:glycosyltransferase involved in cell wall biosynthesis